MVGNRIVRFPMYFYGSLFQWDKFNFHSKQTKKIQYRTYYIVLICYHPQNPIRMKVQLATTGVRNRLSPLSYSPQTTRVYVRVLVTVICSVLVSYTVGIERHVVSQQLLLCQSSTHRLISVMKCPIDIRYSTSYYYATYSWRAKKCLANIVDDISKTELIAMRNYTCYGFLWQ